MTDTVRHVLVVDDDPMIAALLSAGLTRAGLRVTVAENGRAALARLAEELPDLVVSDVMMPEMDGFALVSRLRAEPATRALPLVFLTSRDAGSDVVHGLRLGADDYVTKPFDLDQVVARVLSKLDRPPVPLDHLVRDARTGLLTPARLREEVDREVDRASRTGRPGAVAVVGIEEAALLSARVGPRAVDDLTVQVAALLATDAAPLEQVGRDEAGRFVLLLPERDEPAVQARLESLTLAIARSRLVVAGERVTVTPTAGWARLVEPGAEGGGGELVLARAALAADAAGAQLDLLPVRWTPGLEPVTSTPGRASRDSWWVRSRVARQIGLTLVLGIVVPFLVYLGLYRELGIDVGKVAYLVVLVALLVTAVSIWTEGFLALHPVPPPDEPAGPHPPATALVAAYLPNEALTVVETVEAMLAIDYPDLQVILAYNTPRPLPVQATLAEIAARDPRFLPLQVHGSTSKAQNVNAALAAVTGEFIGVFDADHHPDPGAFRRAWRWLAGGYDVVQGHCVVRNGDASWVARTVAVEFESIYAVSHPGRARLHGFGIFGGSNGYWRTDLLRATRMRGSMLTEDIDSSLRVVEDGGRIASDPGLISRELAPTTLAALWNQRMRWAQGWLQVSLRHLRLMWSSPHLTLRSKLGATFLLGWREVYPWLSLQMIPVVAFLAVRAGGVRRLDWLIPLFVATTLFTLSVGPGQVVFARRLGAAEIRRQRGWFRDYLLVSSLFYTEFKNVIARVAQVKQARGESEWKVTPRQAAEPSPDQGAA